MTGRAPRVVVIGEALVDIVHRPAGVVEEAPGGSPANVALALGRLDRTPTLLTALADDDRGRRILQWLSESGVAVAAVPVSRTATAVARLDGDGAATYEFDLTWALASEDPIVRVSGVDDADLLHVGSVSAVLDPGAEAIATIVRRTRPRATITFDPNIRPSLVDDPEAVRANVETLVALAHVVKASDEDVRWLHPGEDIIDVARAWQRMGPSLVVITRGAGGSVGVTEDAAVEVPSVPTFVVDTVGAGDTFMGALIDEALAHDSDLREGVVSATVLHGMLARCAEAAAITVSRPGADPPRRSELSDPTH